MKNKLSVLHITEDNSETNYGITTVVNDLNTKLVNAKVNTNVISPYVNSNDQYTIYTKPTLQVKPIWKHSVELKKYLLNSEKTISHIHGVWMYPQYIASKIAFEKNIPSIITPHGMLEPWLWENGTLKKKMYFNMMIKKYFSNANVLHAITPNEKENLYKLFGHQNIEVIPNSISYKEVDSYNIIKKSQEKYILFLGRIHPKKGIDLLIKAFAGLSAKNVKLKIAGPINQYKNELDILIKSLNIKNKVEFLGIISGQEKYQVYKDAWVFVAPSFSEVVGMVNLEAGVLETPVITTYQTGLYSEWNNNGGILINPNVNELTKSLKIVISWSDDERNDRGKKLKQFIIDNYSWEKNIYKWIDLYSGLENAKIKQI